MERFQRITWLLAKIRSRKRFLLTNPLNPTLLRVSSRKILLRLLDTVDHICHLLPIQPFLEFKRMVETSLAAIGEQWLPSSMVMVEDKRC